MKFRHLILAGALLASTLAIPERSHAATLTFDMNILVTGMPIPPTWTQPHAKVTFEDTGANQVRITMQALGMNPYGPPGSDGPHNYHVDEWYFNVAPDWTSSDIASSALSFTFNAGLSTGPAALEVIRSLNNIHITGDGNLDVGLKWLDPA